MDEPDGRRKRGIRRQQVVLDAARQLLLEKGYRGTTLEAIIERAGGSRVTIYRVFGGKSGLISAIISQGTPQLVDSLSSPTALLQPPRRALMRFGLQLVGVWRSDEGLAVNRAVISEGLEAPELVAAWYQSGVETSLVALSRYLDAQTDAGRLMALDSRLVARQFITLLMGEMAYPMISGSARPQQPRIAVQRCIELILGAYETNIDATLDVEP